MAIDPISKVLTIGGSLLGGIFGRSGNPNKWAKGKAEEYERLAQAYLDPNNPFYQTQEAQYYRNLSKTLNASSPTKDSLMALMTAGGRSQGASTSIANAQRQAIEARNRDAATSSSENFGSNLVKQGMGFASDMYSRAGDMYNIYASGEESNAEDNRGFASSLLDFGGGLLGDWLGKTPTPEEQKQASTGTGYSGGGTKPYDYTKLGGGGGSKPYNPYKLGGY